jgi:WD40 repeat protein
MMRGALPVPGAPTGVVELAVVDEHDVLQCIVPLPGGDRVATASNKGKVRVFAVATGGLEHELDAHEGDIGGHALAALGGDIIVSGGAADGKVATWNAAGGERLGEAAAGSGVFVIATLDGGRFVAGTRGGARGGDGRVLHSPPRAWHGGGRAHRARAHRQRHRLCCLQGAIGDRVT